VSKFSVPGGGAASADLAERRSRLSAAQRQLLEKRLARGAAAPAAGAAVRPRPLDLAGRGEPLSFAQQRLWRLARRLPGSTAYNVYHGVRFAGRLDSRALAAALGRLVARHEALRTRFPETAQGPVALVCPASGAARLPLPLVDLAGLAERSARQAFERALGDQGGRPFDLARGPLLRASLLRTGPAEHVLLLIVHHIVIDGWSLTVMVRDLIALYAYASAAGRGAAEPPGQDLPPPPLQAADFALWQRQLLSGGELDEELAWWRRRLAGAAPRGMRWPPSGRRPGEAPGGSASLRLGPAASAALKALARRERATLFVVVLAGWKALLNRHSGEDDVLVGTPVALRDRPETAELVGFLLNLLVLRTDLGGDPEFVEVVRRVRETTLEALTHQRVPFECLAAEVGGEAAGEAAGEVAGEAAEPAGAGSGEALPMPWIRGLFNMPTGEAAHAAPLRLPDLEVEPAFTGEMGSEFDWAFYARETDGAIQFDLGYSPGQFAPGAAGALLGELAALFEQVTSDPRRRLSSLGSGGAGPAAHGAGAALSNHS
jgi:hypothetical protein